jgi:hypothetical protein
MEKRYKVLRVIGTIYKVLGGIVAVITILSVLGICVSSVLGGAAITNSFRQYGGNSGIWGLFSGVLGGLIGSVITIISGAALAITLYATGEGVYLLIAIEENTHVTAALLQQQAHSRISSQSTLSETSALIQS